MKGIPIDIHPLTLSRTPVQEDLLNAKRRIVHLNEKIHRYSQQVVQLYLIQHNTLNIYEYMDIPTTYIHSML